MSLQFLLLGFLTYRPTTGYELKQTMDVSTSNFWHAKQSQIYVTLKKMEEKGLIVSELEEQDTRPNRRIYSITENGVAAVQQWLSQPITVLQPKKELTLLKLFFSAKQEKQTLLTQLHLQKDLHKQKLVQYQTITKTVIQRYAAATPNTETDAHLWDATRRYGELFEQMSMQWLDETIVMIEENL